MTVKFEDATLVIDINSPDGNVFAVVGKCKEALKDAGANRYELRDFTDEAFGSGSYDEVLNVCKSWLNVVFLQPDGYTSGPKATSPDEILSKIEESS